MGKANRRDTFQALLKEIRDGYAEKMDALYKLFPEFHPVNANGDGTTRTIRLAIKENPGKSFALDDIIDWSVKVNPQIVNSIDRVSFSNALARMAIRKELKIVSPKGKRPIVYGTIDHERSRT